MTLAPIRGEPVRGERVAVLFVQDTTEGLDGVLTLRATIRAARWWRGLACGSREPTPMQGGDIACVGEGARTLKSASEQSVLSLPGGVAGPRLASARDRREKESLRTIISRRRDRLQTHSLE